VTAGTGNHPGTAPGEANAEADSRPRSETHTDDGGAVNIDGLARDGLIPLPEASHLTRRTPRELLEAAREGDLEVERVAGRTFVRRWSMDALLARGGS